MAMGKTGQEVIAAFAKGVTKGKLPNYGVLKTKLNKLIREGDATAADKEALKILKSSDETATIRQKQAQSTSRSKKPVSLAGSPKVGGTTKSKLQEGLESVGKTKSPKVKKTVSKPMSAAKKKRVEEARKEGSGALIREGLSDVKAYGGSMGKKTVKKKSGGKIGRGCGAATRGGGAVMK